MIRLTQSQNVKGSSGDPLPTVFTALADKGFQFVRGQLCLVCAPPGSGKSAFTLTVALRARMPTFYFSADSDAFIQLTRSIAITNGWTLDEATEVVRAGDMSRVENLGDQPIWFSYDASPTLSDIETKMAAFLEVFEDFPALIIVDNITNVVGSAEDDDPFGGLEALLEYLHGMARSTGACVIGLHHVTGEYNDAAKPIPLTGVKGQLGRVPEQVLTLHRRQAQVDFQSDTLCVSVVKNRGGRADPSGLDYAELEWIGDRMLIRDFA